MKLPLNRAMIAIAALLAIPLMVTPAAMARQAPAQSPSATTIAVGALPTGIAVDPATNRIYVANTNDGTLSVIDGYTNKVIKTIPVGPDPFGVAVDPTRNRIYVANYVYDGTLTVVDGWTNKVIATVACQHNSVDVAVNTTTNVIYVANQSSNSVNGSNLDGTLSVLNGHDDHVDHTRTVGAFLDGIAVDPQTDTVYIGNLILGTITVYDGKTNTVTGTISLPDSSAHPVAMAMDTSRDRLFVTTEHDVLYTVNGKTSQVVNTEPGFDQPQGIALDAPAQVAFVANSGDGSLAEVNTGNHSITATFTTGSSPWGVALNPVTKRLYVSNSGSGTVTVFTLSSSSQRA
jgi:YVTN family beta-propeller protein